MNAPELIVLAQAAAVERWSNDAPLLAHLGGPHVFEDRMPEKDPEDPEPEPARYIIIGDETAAPVGVMGSRSSSVTMAASSWTRGELDKAAAVETVRLMDAALAQPRVLVHRDFMPRNLMPAGAGLAVLDFQDAVVGPIGYDPVSLFKDAFLSWPDTRVADWLARYHARALDAGLPVPGLPRFLRDADWIGVQRHLKVIGIFARLCHRDGKPKYLADVPRFFGYLDAVLPRYPELEPLQALLERLVKPAMAARQ